MQNPYSQRLPTPKQAPAKTPTEPENEEEKRIIDNIRKWRRIRDLIDVDRKKRV